MGRMNPATPDPAQLKSLCAAPQPACGQPNLGLAILRRAEKEVTPGRRREYGLTHPGQFGVADQVLFEVRIQRTLASEPGERTLGFPREFDLRKGRGGRRVGRDGDGGFVDADVNEFGAGADAGVHAAGGDEFGLGLGVGGEGVEQRSEVGVGEFGELAAQEAAEVAAGDAALAGEVGLVHLASLQATLQGDAEVAHNGGRRWKIAD